MVTEKMPNFFQITTSLMIFKYYTKGSRNKTIGLRYLIVKERRRDKTIRLRYSIVKEGRRDKTIEHRYLIVKKGRRDKTIELRYLIVKEGRIRLLTEVFHCEGRKDE